MLQALHDFYGEVMGPRIARKHVGWYLKAQDQLGYFKRQFNVIDCPLEQLKTLEIYLNN